MTDIQGSVNWPDDFSGRVKLFPLPNLVLFPHVVQPLHIFEPRYCEMLADALNSDRLIASALLHPGWEADVFDCPAIENTVCIGKVISHSPTDDNRHNILLVGLKRARIVREIESATLYRQAEVSLLEDYYPSGGDSQRKEIQERLQELFSTYVPGGVAAQESFKQLVGKQLPLGILTDTITYALSLPLTIKQQLLAEHNVEVRSRLLIRCLEQKVSGNERNQSEPLRDEFPPRFSEN
ncbi:MAG: LON peptidase substrate-binding domain-containing protein [Planctomycetales bacterium]|nr:LON peptidase substrate-binding domain-containing protein [Planctomycetales bacterium]